MDPGFSEQQSTYAQYPQYSAPSQFPQYPAQQQQPGQVQPAQQQYNDAFPRMAPSTKRSRGGSLVKGTGEIFQKKWPRYFLLVAFLQAVLCIVFEAYTFAKFQSSLKDMSQAQFKSDEKVQSQLKTIPTFLALFIFGFLYVLLLCWDALRMKNTIQVIGLCIANVALLVYTGIQIDQIKEAVDILKEQGAMEEEDFWNSVKPLLVAVPGILAVASVCLGFIAWKLYQEFAWDILKHIGADYRMKKRFLYYQVYIALLKFDFFFFLGFTIQFLVIVGGKTDAEFGLTSAAVPVTIAILLAAAVFVRKEWKWGMISVIILYLGGLAYFIFKLSRIYDETHKDFYKSVKKSLTTFAVLTIILIVLTIINAMICMFNFGAGLKQHLETKPQREMDKDQASYSMNDVKPQLPSRMTID
ncbi:hypothetical protein PG996_005800 [Apiospora saccharicola]|uniref:Uncharacterized protein n=1 Tax=Apiospora saccharicola TaxID=335842 RepID=A0ABR1VMK5_9PEZI